MTAGLTRRPTGVTTRMAAVGAIAVAGAVLLTACGDQTDDGSDKTPPSGSQAPLFSELPKDIQDSKVIKVGSDIAYPPVEFVEGGKTVGFDPDLADAMGKELGVTFEFQNGTFDTLLTGMRSGRYQIAMSAMTDTKERQNGIDPDSGKKIFEGVDFVDYFSAGVSLYTNKGETKSIATWDDLCGKKIVVQRGTVSHDLAKDQSEKCEKDGKEAISIQAFDTDVEAQTRLRAGGADVGASDFPVAAYAVKTSGGGNDFELLGEQVKAAPYGIAVGKENTQLRDALKAALEAVIKSGAYDKLVAKWGVEDGAVKDVTVNGGS